MELQDFVSKNLLLEKADHDVIVKDTVLYGIIIQKMRCLSPHSFVTFPPAEPDYTG